MLDSEKSFKKTILFCSFSNLLLEKEKYELYALNNIYGSFRLNEEANKMYDRDKKILLDFKERLDILFE